jgi:hypothetical protein
MDAGDENGYIAPDPLSRDVVYGGTVSRQDLSNEEIQRMPPMLAHAARTGGHGLCRWCFRRPIHTCCTGTQALFERRTVAIRGK